MIGFKDVCEACDQEVMEYDRCEKYKYRGMHMELGCVQ